MDFFGYEGGAIAVVLVEVGRMIARLSRSRSIAAQNLRKIGIRYSIASGAEKAGGDWKLELVGWVVGTAALAVTSWFGLVVEALFLSSQLYERVSLTGPRRDINRFMGSRLLSFAEVVETELLRRELALGRILTTRERDRLTASFHQRHGGAGIDLEPVTATPTTDAPATGDEATGDRATAMNVLLSGTGRNRYVDTRTDRSALS